MQARRGGVETDIGGNDLLRGESVEPLGIGGLVDVTALVEHAQEIGFVGHSARALSMAAKFLKPVIPAFARLA